jgi:hypothetical protein
MTEKFLKERKGGKRSDSCTKQKHTLVDRKEKE